MDSGGGGEGVERDALTPVPADERVSWRAPALIFGGLEFTIPVLMAGAALSEHSGLAAVPGDRRRVAGVQWSGNALQGYTGAASGLSSTFLARRSFGVGQSRFVIGPLLALMSMGWWTQYRHPGGVPPVRVAVVAALAYGLLARKERRNAA